MKVVEETFRQLLQKVCCVWHKQIFVWIDEDFAINLSLPKLLSLLLTGKICIGVDRKWYSQKVIVSDEYPVIQMLCIT